VVSLWRAAPGEGDLDAPHDAFRLEVWRDRRELPMRIKTLFTSAVDRGWFWASTEFFDYGVGVDLSTGVGPDALRGTAAVSDV
jgi:hypothetical protein